MKTLELPKKALIDSENVKILLKEEVRIENLNNSTLKVINGDRSFQTTELPSSIISSLNSLAFIQSSKSELSGNILESDGYSILTRFLFEIDRFDAFGLLNYTFYNKEKELFLIEKMINSDFRYERIRTEKRFRLSAHSFIRNENGRFLLESSNSDLKIHVKNNVILSLIFYANKFVSFEELTEKIDLPYDVMAEILNLLIESKIFELESTTSDENALWSFHDFLFHNRTRFGNHNYPCGGTYRFIGKTNPPLARRNHSLSKKIIKLPIPTNEKGSMRLEDCLKSRTSHRYFDSISIEQLAEILYKSFRIRKVIPMDISNKDGVTERIETLRSMYPSGGGLYELGIYLTINNCVGLENGFYWYNKFKHELSLIKEPSSDTDAVNWYAKMCTGTNEIPPIVLTFSADFKRMFWKYENMAYATILKNVGAAYQTLYLVLTDMGLGGCAMGNGNVEVFKSLIERSKQEESSVGEFILGTPKTYSNA